MKLKKLFIIYLVAVFAVPGAMIFCHERVLQQGESFLFKTKPVDPYDLFRGRYVALSFEQDTFEYQGTDTFNRNDIVYAVIGKDSQGIARVETLLRAKPKAGAFLRVKVSWHNRQRWVQDEQTKKTKPIPVNTVHFELPFKRFYMNEKKAFLADGLTLIARPNDPQRLTRVIVAQIRIRKGYGVIENLLLNGKPIAEELRGKTY